MRSREKRRHSRHACNLKITYTILSNREATPYEYGVSQSKDLSESGVCLFTDQAIEIPILMQMNISIPVRPFQILVLGKSLRCRRVRDEELYEVGVKFVGQLPSTFKQMVAEFGSALSPEA